MQYYPLNPLFSAVSTLGLVVSATATYLGVIGISWGSAFTLLFSIFFIASLITLKPTIYELH